MAEAQLRQMFDEAGVDAEVQSAGTHAYPGAPAHPDAMATVAEYGLDLSSHQAQSLTEEVVQWADIILGMQPRHVTLTLALDSTADARLITEFSPEPQRRLAGITDPIGWGRDVYEVVFDEIRASLGGFVDSHAQR